MHQGVGVSNTVTHHWTRDNIQSSCHHWSTWGQNRVHVFPERLDTRYFVLRPGAYYKQICVWHAAFFSFLEWDQSFSPLGNSAACTVFVTAEGNRRQIVNLWMGWRVSSVCEMFLLLKDLARFPHDSTGSLTCRAESTNAHKSTHSRSNPTLGHCHKEMNQT